MKPRVTKPGPTLTAEQLQDYERHHGLSLPAPLTAFLLASNGGGAREYSVGLPDGTATSGLDFLGAYAAPDRDQIDIAATRSMLGERLRTELLPLAWDGVGNLFCVSSRPKDSGTVWFWDHDTEKAERCAAGLDAFLESFQPIAPPPISDDQRFVKEASVDEVLSEIPGLLQRHSQTWVDSVLVDRLDVAKRLLTEGSGHGILLTAAKRGAVDAVRELIAMGANIEIDNGRGCTPLMFAAANSHAETVAVLLEAGADPTRKDVNGSDAARTAGNPSISTLVRKAQEDWQGKPQ